ncbi:mechanosensitive ion channel family protein [Parvularcula sp. LCG005]|uniref:mechanosensitive ion channel family protein n=1 Tax=Parvularcula sp. LCG005 TaxID=3078805 RepID=UPI0029436D55|nr:mechanosensitive ion channel family protein [Parvularcula sp. LCG005]WOI53858.1 mechanosensitive ion channel family protein [Parvularcula sp. LCG005]
MIYRIALACALMLCLPDAAFAQDDRTPVEAAASPGTITLTDGDIAIAAEDANADDAIEARLRGIFDVIPALSNVDITVQQGVVRLNGTVVETDAADQAETLAGRVSGVVAVDNAVQIDSSVDKRLGPAAQRTRAVLDDTISLLPLLAIALVTAILFWLAGALIARQKWLWSRVAPNPLISNLIRMVVPIIFGLLGVVIALNILDAVAILSAVLGAAGVLGLAVGFAVKDTIENFISSIMLSIRQPFRANDLVEIDGLRGNVVRLTSRATILMTPDGNHVRIPNANVFNAIITNYTRNPERRITFALGVDADDDPVAGIDTGLAALQKLDFVLAEPTPTAWIEEVGDSNIVLTFAPWINQSHTDFLKAKSASIRAVKQTLEEKGFTLPEPIYRLRIDGVPSTLATELPSSAKEGSQAAPPEPKVKAIAKGEMDTRPDKSIEKKVSEDRAATREEDLLSAQAPTEFGDEGQTPKA